MAPTTTTEAVVKLNEWIEAVRAVTLAPEFHPELMLVVTSVLVALAYALFVSAPRSAGHVRLDALYFAFLGTWSTLRLWPTFVVAVRPWLFGATLCGWMLGGLERYAIGVAFHAIPRFRVAHEAYHDRLRQRRCKGHYEHSDALHEILSYNLIFAGVHLVLRYGIVLDTILALRVWHGLLLEHWLGDLLRACVQFEQPVVVRANPPKPGRLQRWVDNASAYYWWHIMVHPLQCAGFSTALWDTLSGRQPGAVRAWCPLPFVSFWTTDYARLLEPQLTAAWAEYARDPIAFQRRMIALHE